MSVGHLDTDEGGRPVVREPQLEVAPGDAAVEDGVGREFRDDEGDGVGGRAAVRQLPEVEMVCGEPPGEASASADGGEALDEQTYGYGLLGLWS
jgi:hypothetical protein